MAAYTQVDLDRICEAISKGVLEVRYQDKLTKFRNLDEMLQIKALIEKELGTKKKSIRRVGEFDKGIC